MKLKDLAKEEIETMSYDDLAYLILEENGKKMKLLDIFKKVAKVLNMSDEERDDKLVAFFELLSTNKQFAMLDKGYWDLSHKHMKSVVVEDDEDIDIDQIDGEDKEIDNEITEDDEDYYGDEDEDQDNDDDLSDLVVIDPEDETSLE